MYDPPIEVKEQFISSGWFPGRLVQVPEVLLSHKHATEILRRYSGLTVGEIGTGVAVSSSDITFRIPQSDNPEDYDKKADWENLLKTKLISVGHVHHEHGEMYIGSDGRCYGRSYMHDAMWLEGVTFTSAVVNLLTGMKVKPMLHPDQNSVSVYGIEYGKDHADLYNWEGV